MESGTSQWSSIIAFPESRSYNDFPMLLGRLRQQILLGRGIWVELCDLSMTKVAVQHGVIGQIVALHQIARLVKERLLTGLGGSLLILERFLLRQIL